MVEDMTSSEIKELISDEFNELQYADYSYLGTTASILTDYRDFFEANSKEYYHYIKSLFLLNCTSSILEWYKKMSPKFLTERIITPLVGNLHFESAKSEMQQLITLVNDYLADKHNDISRLDDLVSVVDGK